MPGTTTRAELPVTRGRRLLFACHVFKGLIKAKEDEIMEGDGRTAEVRKLEARIGRISRELADLLLAALDAECASEELDYFAIHALKTLVTKRAEELLDHGQLDMDLARRMVRVAIRASRPTVRALLH